MLLRLVLPVLLVVLPEFVLVVLPVLLVVLPEFVLVVVVEELEDVPIGVDASLSIFTYAISND